MTLLAHRVAQSRVAAADTKQLIQALQRSGVIRVTDGEKTFYVLCKSHQGGPPYGYAPSRDGRRPVPGSKFRMLTLDVLWDWLSKLRPVH